MRSLVMELSSWAKSQKEGFLIVAQNAQELATESGDPGGFPMMDYLAALDGTGREDLHFGYLADDQATPPDEASRLEALCRQFTDRSLPVLVIDYCSSPDMVFDAYAKADALGFVAFAAPDRELRLIPEALPHQANSAEVTRLAEARNFLYLINGENHAGKADFLAAVAATDYDLVIMDLFQFEEPFTAAEIAALRAKPLGGSRLLLAYLSIGEAEDYRWYWDPGWKALPPDWLGEENPDWAGNYLVEYWRDGWKDILRGNEESYLGRIIGAGFDGAYLDLVDAYERYE